ncbi:disks large homolog 1-like isoform X2 [Ptychodera flava]|uniref:disks large homolog 1-like isoform X2 n=1 Tax=Ptychodera flava TaxID=63121 RepID=UPI003969BCC7
MATDYLEQQNQLQRSVWFEPVVIVVQGLKDPDSDDDDIATLDSDSASGLSAEWSESPYDARRVELEEGRRGFGFSLSGGVMSPLGHVPLFIASVDPHGPAAKTGMLQPGDRIVAINGEEYGREIPQRCGDCHQGCLWTDHVRCHARRREHSRFHCNGLKNFNMLF